MASSSVVPIQLLLLVSLTAASHFYGGSMTFTAKGRNPDGTYSVTLRSRATYSGCFYPSWSCYRGNCGYSVSSQRGRLDSSPNAPGYNKRWCETEIVMTRKVPNDKPFQMRKAGCCWVSTRNNVGSWRLLTQVDLGTRSDTGKPNRSPDVTILPLLRVPQNCPRSYNLMTSDPDGDRVRCRYGTAQATECNRCSQPNGFQLDQGSCTLRYGNNSRTGTYGLELVVEDFPESPITLVYMDGSKSTRFPLTARRGKRSLYGTTIAYPWWWYSPTTMPPAATANPYHTTPQPTPVRSWWWWHTLTATPPSTMTTTPLPTTTRTPHWWWWHTTTTTTTPPSTTTTTPPPTTTPYWWWHTTTTTTPPSTTTTTPRPTTTPYWWWWWLHTTTTTTTPPTTTTTTSLPTTTTTPWWYTTTTTTRPTTTPYWWWWLHTTTTTTTPPTTTTTTSLPTTTTTPWWHTTTTTTPPSTTTTTPRPTTTPYWWWWLHTTTTTTTPPTTTTTTSLPTTTTTPWWYTTTTTTRPTTTPYWWWWLHTTTTTTTPPTATTTTSLPTTTTTPWWYTTTTTPPPTTTTTATTTISTPWWWQQHSTTTHRLTTTTRGTRSTTGHPHAATPLSKLPLHFSFSVDLPAPSCHEGEFLPRFLPPTPRHGEQLHAEVNKEMQIRIKAQATRATLDNVIMSGPLNISKQKTTRDEFIIKWTPVPDDLGERFPICFAVESLVRTRVYQSEMRCVVVSVGRGQVKANVICYENSMRVEVAKSSLEGLSADHLRLSDPSNTACSFRSHSNTTHVVAVIPLNACGTQIEEDDENLIFKNEITTFDNPNDIITRKHLLEVEFYCQYPKRGNVSTGFTAHRNNVTVKERGFGTFTYQLEFYHSNRFRTVIDPNSYPLEFDIGDEIYMEIEATSSVNNTELFVESCRAAPYDNPNYRPTYSIIENGCAVDKTVEIYSPRHNNHFMFGMEAFKFIGLHDQVYISCAIILCEAGNPNTRCSRGCINSTSPLSHRHISKREAVIQTSSHFISQGPLRLRRASESTVTSINLNLVFIVGCLLAAVAMVCGVVISKGKMSRVSYQRLPNFET